MFLLLILVMVTFVDSYSWEFGRGGVFGLRASRPSTAAATSLLIGTLVVGMGALPVIAAPRPPGSSTSTESLAFKTGKSPVPNVDKVNNV